MVEVYRITNRENGKQYFGVASYGARKRFNQHVAAARRGAQTVLARSIRKYGRESFDVQTLVVCPDIEYAFRIEAGLVAAHNTIAPRGLNSKGGGIGPTEVSEEQRAKHRDGRIGKRHSPEARARIAEARKGVKWSDERRAAFSAARKGYKWSEAQRAGRERAAMAEGYGDKMRANNAKAKRGPLSDEVKRKISDGLKAYNAGAK